MACETCSDDEVFLQDYYGAMLCQDCIELERTTDWDQHEEDKRERIAEQNEH